MTRDCDNWKEMLNFLALERVKYLNSDVIQVVLSVVQTLAIGLVVVEFREESWSDCLRWNLSL